ncbi:glucosyltransferase [Cadophora gregata]|uniref:glucosyltransferase n=1 Tax=Cadophora gregata TaxID=51156 RepID=UPI0026DD33A6|nr:glucosyltransferase [Cadophora gregata]KAK0121437.1 glucosyltransferase [Cadophora gregata]KAK0126910.1 glucosyltransferase [Cadophora gregata f. sp. sojae]
MLASSISLPWANTVLAWIASSLVMLDTPLSPLRLLKSFQVSVLVANVALYSLAKFWLGQVTKLVREPYLDEVFHIPQAQAYCNGRYDMWDPKLTTPPGLYIFSTLYAKLSAYGKCSPAVLRSFNVFALIMVFSYACDCRALISRSRARNAAAPRNSSIAFGVQNWAYGPQRINPDELHTALNIALFPILFFFSGLFYTDVLSTCVVLRVYRLFLERRGAYQNSSEGLIWLYLTGIVSLWMRQTNVFWVAVFMGGLEVVRTIDANQTPDPGPDIAPYRWKDICIFYFKRYGNGQIHDVPLGDAGVHDFILCAVSVAVAAVFHPLLLVTRLWPYIGLLLSFVAFVIWNGGVVLGDKANHVATIHIPQMLYIWPFMAFFSAPLIVPIGLSFLHRLFKLFSLPLFPRLVWQYLLAAIYTAGALAVTLVIIKFNTIIHPFTLADNRHYMFYVFRYTILKHPMVRYLLAPVYLICGFLVYLTLCAQSTTSPTTLKKKRESSKNSDDQPRAEEKPATNTQSDGPTTSFVLILLLTTALSLITAPLVEPRYFIIPWVIWRLNVPSLPPPRQAASSPKSKSKSKSRTDTARQEEISRKIISWIRFWGWEGHDYRLWLETVWFLGINAATGYIFLYRGYEWKQEPGNVQRFMW